LLRKPRLSHPKNDISHGRLYVGTIEGDLLCLSASDGAVLWRHRTGGGIYPAPAIDENTIYTGSWDGFYYAFDREKGHLRWIYSRPGWPYNLGGRPDSAAPVLWKGNVLVQVLGAYLVALDRETGKMVWEAPAPPGYLNNGTPAAAGNSIFMSVFMDAMNCPIDARVFALDDGTGQIIWEYPGGGGLTAPLVARNKAFFGSTTDVFFTCVDAKGNGDGTTDVIWRFKLGGVVEESIPAIYGNKAFVLCSDGYLYAIR
jgi:outer membrane protein assembly factor BamB